LDQVSFGYDTGRGSGRAVPAEAHHEPAAHTREPVSPVAETSSTDIASNSPVSPLGPHPRPRRAPPRSEPLQHANIEMRPDEYQALVEGRRVALTVREFEVLLMLAEHIDRVVPRARVYEAVWGSTMKYRERAIDVFVRKLRTKLAEAAPDWVYIHTHFGIGYRFAPERRRGGSPAPADAPPTRRR
jgi:DNA-binding response OmpR family regulator